ncbi:zinc transporter ZIP2 [Caerostris extrusa]|uniref:Zinc transporter ZIP2 n=1 Tax=Caerostris extrusa TaxID=172846 RepID=A0AAV4MVG0_CAEEX|nr:zinc transporter ZIP2 [Caerostris extrusa]
MSAHSALVAARISCMILLLVGTLIFGILPVYVKKNLFRCDCNSETCKPNCKARKDHGHGDSANKDAAKAEGKEEEHHESFPMPEFIVCCGFFAVYLFEEIVHYFLGGHTHVPSENKALRSFSKSSACDPSVENGLNLVDDDHHHHHHEPPSFSLTGLLTVAALSFHSLFEGFAVGLRPDAMSTWIVFAAISVHKFVISFVVGLEVLATGGKNKHVYSYMSVFAIMSPLGMLIAMITDNNLEDSSPMTVSVLNAIATGTLLYVTFFEILQRDEHKDIATWVQLIATSAGFAVMCFIQYGSTFA